jgi:hypothetical protein
MVTEVEVAHAEARQIGADVALAVEQEPVPVRKRRAAEVEAGLVREMRRAEEFALEVVGPAMTAAMLARCRGPSAWTLADAGK